MFATVITLYWGNCRLGTNAHSYRGVGAQDQMVRLINIHEDWRHFVHDRSSKIWLRGDHTARTQRLTAGLMAATENQWHRESMTASDSALFAHKLYYLAKKWSGFNRTNRTGSYAPVIPTLIKLRRFLPSGSNNFWARWKKVYELHKTWCADTLLSNSVICAIEVLQHDKQKCWSPKCI